MQQLKEKDNALENVKALSEQDSDQVVKQLVEATKKNVTLERTVGELWMVNNELKKQLQGTCWFVNSLSA